MEFSKLPSVYNVYRVFLKTYWWKKFSGSCKRGGKTWLSERARKLLYATTGEDLREMGNLPTAELLKMETSSGGLHAVKNFLSTGDGLCLTLLFAGKGMLEVNNWKYFDKVMHSYLCSAVFDLFKEKGSTYYGRLKAVRGYIKDKSLKERAQAHFSDVGPEFWFLKPFFDKYLEGKELLSYEGLTAVAYLTQTRACGLAPRALQHESFEKFLLTVEQQPEKPTDLDIELVTVATHEVATEILGSKNFREVLNRALLNSKVSLSNSACLTHPRRINGKLAGKAEAARKIMRSLLGKRLRIFNLENGSVSQVIQVTESDADRAGMILFHYAIAEAMMYLKTGHHLQASPEPECYRITDCRVSTVVEQGKARMITVSSLEHSLVLHPLAHVFSTFISQIPSSHTGMKASNHMWEFYKRTSPLIPPDGIFRHETGNPKKMFLGNEDWSEATDRLSPYLAHLMVCEFGKALGMPTFYLTLCARMLVQERRLFTARLGHLCGQKRSGILQGDPLTKQVLHLSHLVSRKISERMVREVCHRINHGFPVTVHQDKQFRPFPVVPMLKDNPDAIADVFRRYMDRPTLRTDEDRKKGLFKDLSVFTALRKNALADKP
jgi:hypothetical protein